MKADTWRRQEQGCRLLMSSFLRGSGLEDASLLLGFLPLSPAIRARTAASPRQRCHLALGVLVHGQGHLRGEQVTPSTESRGPSQPDHPVSWTGRHQGKPWIGWSHSHMSVQPLTHTVNIAVTCSRREHAPAQNIWTDDCWVAVAPKCHAKLRGLQTHPFSDEDQYSLSGALPHL